MDLLTLALGYVGVTALFIFLLLFGESPVFTGTPVESLHWLVTAGVCDGADWLVRKCCGQRGSRAMEKVYGSLCERRNPVLQVVYAIMLVGTFIIYYHQLLMLLPNAWADEEHFYLAVAITLLSGTLFVMASLSDPGTVTHHNVAAHAALYPLDGVVYPEKRCATCTFDRPARSKHCSVCNRCVARFDHHCAWINNCVGLANMRLFLAFLASNLAMCSYGLVLACLILGGEMERRGVFRMRVMDWSTGQVKMLVSSPSRVVEWLMVYYPVQLALALFMAVASLLMIAFLGYQMYLFTQGKTQNEVFKWRDIYVVMRHQALQLLDLQEEAQEQQDAQGQSQQQGDHQSQGQQQQQQHQRENQSQQQDISSHSQGQQGQQQEGKQQRQRRGWLASWWRARRVAVEMPPNTYHRGFRVNLAEVLLPDLYLDRAKRRAAAGAPAGPAAGGAAGAGAGESAEAHRPNAAGGSSSSRKKKRQ